MILSNIWKITFVTNIASPWSQGRGKPNIHFQSVLYFRNQWHNRWGKGGQSPPETSDLEFSADLPCKQTQGKKGKWSRKEGKSEKGMWKIVNWKEEKLQNEERAFVKTYLLRFTFQTTFFFFLAVPNWEFSTGKKHFTPGEKSGKLTLCPLWKIFLLRPCSKHSILILNIRNQYQCCVHKVYLLNTVLQFISYVLYIRNKFSAVFLNTAPKHSILKVDMPILTCIFFTSNWLTLTSEMHFVKFHPEVASCFLSRGKR